MTTYASPVPPSATAAHIEATSPRLSRNFFFFNDPATTELSPLSLPDALPIWCRHAAGAFTGQGPFKGALQHYGHSREARSEEHTSELQSRQYLVCRLLLE